MNHVRDDVVAATKHEESAANPQNGNYESGHRHCPLVLDWKVFSRCKKNAFKNVSFLTHCFGAPFVRSNHDPRVVALRRYHGAARAIVAFPEVSGIS